MLGLNLLLFLNDCLDGIGIKIKVDNTEYDTKYYEEFDYELKGERLYIYNLKKEYDFVAFDNLDQLHCVDDDFGCVVHDGNMVVEFEML